MPARLTQQARPKHHRTKPINKTSLQQLSPLSTRTLDSDGNDQPIQNMEPTPNASKKHFILLLKQLQTRLRYGLDTLLTCLMLFKQVGSVPEGKEKLLAAALMEIAAKVHEFRTPQFMDFAAWGDFSFCREELVIAQSQLLIRLGFKVPAVLNCRTLKQAEQAVGRCEAQIVAF